MSCLNKEQQDLILDFYFRCGDDLSINMGRDLIAANPEAAKLYDNLESTLKELDAIKYEPCPDNLVEVTIARLKRAASQMSQGPLEHKDTPTRFAISDLILAEQNKSNLPFSKTNLPAKTRISRHRLAQIAAIAAVLLTISGIGFPVFSNLRQSSWKTACLANFGRLGQAITRYAGDHDGQLPSVPMEAGMPWYKIADQGSENQSNTRHLWILIQQDYSTPADFVCPGHRQSQAACGDSGVFSRLNDFPCHRNISYSYQLLCGKNNLDTSRNSLLLADRNPLFENLCSCCDPANRTGIEGFQVILNPQLSVQASSNHRGRGQNILYRDGSVVFIIDRMITGDDIYTLKNVTRYRGTETPCNDGTDNFLVP
jgi:hypothetical protein